MVIDDATLRNLAGERDRIARSKHLITDRHVMAAIAQTSEIAAELLRHRASERADKDRVRQVVRQALQESMVAFTVVGVDGDALDVIAERAADRLAVAVLECPVHRGSIHGGGAEELRKGVEQIMLAMPEPFRGRLIRLLDRVDARDSLAHLEREDQPAAAVVTAGGVTDAALLTDVPKPPANALLISEDDRDTLARFARESPYPVESAAIRDLLAGRQPSTEARDRLVVFSATGDTKWPRTCAALRRVLEALQ